MKRKIGVAALGVTAFLLAAGATMAQTASPTTAPSPTTGSTTGGSGTTMPAGAPNTGNGPAN